MEDERWEREKKDSRGGKKLRKDNKAYLFCSFYCLVVPQLSHLRTQIQQALFEYFW